MCVCFLHYFCNRVTIISKDGFKFYKALGAGYESHTQGCDGSRQTPGPSPSPGQLVDDALSTATSNVLWSSLVIELKLLFFPALYNICFLKL